MTKWNYFSGMQGDTTFLDARTDMIAYIQNLKNLPKKKKIYPKN